MNETEIRISNYVHFKLGAKEFIMDISIMEEVIDISDIVQIPDVPPFIKGVTRLRMQVIPVIDIKAKLGIEETDYDEKAKIIVIRYKNESVGLLIDRLIGVADFTDEQLRESGAPGIIKLEGILE